MWDDRLLSLGHQPEDETRFIVAVGDLSRQLTALVDEVRESTQESHLGEGIRSVLEGIDEHLVAIPGNAEDAMTHHQVALAHSRFREIRRMLGELETMMAPEAARARSLGFGVVEDLHVGLLSNPADRDDVAFVA